MALRTVKLTLNLSPETHVANPVEKPIDADVTKVSAIAAPAMLNPNGFIMFAVEPVAAEELLHVVTPAPALNAYFSNLIVEVPADGVSTLICTLLML